MDITKWITTFKANGTPCCRIISFSYFWFSHKYSEKRQFIFLFYWYTFKIFLFQNISMLWAGEVRLLIPSEIYMRVNAIYCLVFTLRSSAHRVVSLHAALSVSIKRLWVEYTFWYVRPPLARNFNADLMYNSSIDKELSIRSHQHAQGF